MVRAAFDSPITAGTYSRLAALMQLSADIKAHMLALRTIPTNITAAADYPSPRDANLTSKPKPRVPKRPRATKEAHVKDESLTLALVESRLSHEAAMAKERQRAMDEATAKRQSWTQAYEHAWNQQQQTS